jgi:hypothetical protein
MLSPSMNFRIRNFTYMAESLDQHNTTVILSNLYVVNPALSRCNGQSYRSTQLFDVALLASAPVTHLTACKYTHHHYNTSDISHPLDRCDSLVVAQQIVVLRNSLLASVQTWVAP